MHNKAKLALFLFVIFLLLQSVAYADFDVAGAYAYLISKSSNGSYNNNVIDSSLAMLALNAIGRDVSKESVWLLSQENDQKCWPKQSCTVKDTAFAMLALNDAGIDISAEEGWLFKAQSVASLSGEWLLEVATADTGTCRISYELNNQTIEKEVQIVRGYFPGCGNTTFFNIDNCLANGIANSQPSLEIDVNCNSLTAVDSITVLFRTGNSWYLVDEDQATRARLTLKNGCFGTKFKTACDYESTLYANYALKSISSKLDNIFYLKQGYDIGNPLHNSILYLVTNELPYSKELANRQRNDGSWNQNVYQTAFGALALKGTEYSANIENAKVYFGKKQLADKSLGNVQDTAITLYAAYSDASDLPECFGNEVKPCDKQTGSCEGSYEICSNNTFLGCIDETYEFFNSTYEGSETLCDNLDNDCDGSIDTGCSCAAGETQLCGLQDGVCEASKETCTSDGVWPGCDYTTITGYEEREESCKDDKDNDCDKLIDLVDDDCIASSVCNRDSSCDENRGETAENCPEDCEEDTCNNGKQDDFEEGVDCGGVCDKECKDVFKICNDDGVCDSDLGETSENCPEDCEEVPEEGECNNDSICDTNEGSDCADCKEVLPPAESGSWIIWFILLLLIAIGFAGYIVYKKKYKKPEKGKLGAEKGKESKPPIFESFFGAKKDGAKKEDIKPLFGTSKKPATTELEKELEKSLSEAKKLIGKEK